MVGGIIAKLTVEIKLWKSNMFYLHCQLLLMACPLDAARTSLWIIIRS